MFFGLRFAAGTAASLVGFAGAALAQEAEIREIDVQDIEVVQVQTDEANAETLALEVDKLVVWGEAPQAEQALEAYAVQADAGSGLWLGVQLAQELPPALAHHLGDKKGALVESVYPDSPAAETGLESYDLIIRLGDKSIESHEGLVEAMQSAEEKPIDVVILRGGEKKTISVTPRKRRAPEATEAQVQDTFFYAVPHMRFLPAIQGEQAGLVWQHLVTEGSAAALPENVESLKVQWERNGDEVTPTYEIVTADGKVFKASTPKEIEALPQEIRSYIPKGPHTAKLGIRLDRAPHGLITARPAPGFAPALTLTNVVPPPPVPAPVAGVVVAQPPTVVQPQTLTVPAWADVYRGAPGAPPQARFSVNRLAEPSPQLDELKAEMQKLNGALERIEKLLQKDD